MDARPLSLVKKQRPSLTNLDRVPLALMRDHTLVLTQAAVLPEQFYSSPRGTARTRWQVALMHAVLTDAIECYHQQFPAQGRCREQLAKEAEAWLFSNDARWPFAFVNVCAVLGMEPDYVRRGLKRWGQSPPATVEHNARHATSAVVTEPGAYDGFSCHDARSIGPHSVPTSSH